MAGSNGPTPRRNDFMSNPPLSLATNLSAAHRFGNPASATPASAYAPPFSPAGSQSPLSVLPSRLGAAVAPRGPSGLMNSYNPQQWTGHGPPSGQYVPHSRMQRIPHDTREMSGQEALLPSPPPPYTPSPTDQASLDSRMVESPAQASSYPSPPSLSPQGTAVPHQLVPRGSRNFSPSSTTQPVVTSFPPPPGAQRDRSGSRTRSVFTNIAALAGRNRTSEGVSPSPVARQPFSHPQEIVPTFPTQPQQANELHQQFQAPPTARRAISAGPSGSTGLLHTRRDLVEEDPRRRSFVLPPPPPGPPPNQRSQSTDTSADRSLEQPSQELAPQNAALQFRTFPSQGTILSPMPPTPADWVDEPLLERAVPTPEPRPSERTSFEGRTNDTRANRQSALQDLEQNSALNERSPRGPSNIIQPAPVGIRERRTQSRTRGVASPSSYESENNHWPSTADSSARPADLVLASSNIALGRSKLPNKHRPRSILLDVKNSPEGASDVEPTPASQQSNTTPASTSGPDVSLSPAIPLSGAAATPQDPPSAQVSASAVSVGDLDEFYRASLDRYTSMLRQEATNGSDRERLELFSAFMVHESRLRRERYAGAFESMGSDVLDLTRDLWRMPPARESKPIDSAQSLTSPVNRVPSRSSVRTSQEPSSASSDPGSAPFTPATEPESPDNLPKLPRIRTDRTRQDSFQPCLSPIESMAASTGQDEDSRGRPASRWWEGSVTSGSIADGGRRIERTKRESRYMGVPKEAREKLQWDDVQGSPGFNTYGAGPSTQYHTLGPNEYPPEKVGWHDQQTPTNPGTFSPPPPKTPLPNQLDISRLITLPPPYPRHHPALNNNHPDLAHLRATLRTLNDDTASRDIRERLPSRQEPAQSDDEVRASLTAQRQSLRMQIQQRIQSGEISFTQAAAEETRFEQEADAQQRAITKKQFDVFQKQVFSPLNVILADKVSKATAAVDELQLGLTRDSESRNPNHTQEEGDEQPELLEKLTLLKWFYEARESVHKEAFDLQDESNQLYKQVAIAPYLVSGARDKIAEIDSFFSKDAADRKLKHETAAAKRFDTFLAFVERPVTRGIEAQLSAFWDIAPPLLAIVQKVPASEEQLRNINLHIPQEELDEDPSYRDHPLQYLYTLLAHARKSAYQFIESQTNLLCLLHEVRSAVMSSGSRLLETQRILAGENEAEVKREMDAARSEEDSRLTLDLKERVSLIEDQWQGALGSGLDECKGRVARVLRQTAGWDDTLDD